MVGVSKFKIKWKKYKKKTSKYKNIFLILLVIFTFVLDNYSNYTRESQNKEEDKLSFYASFGKYKEDNDFIYVGRDEEFIITNNIFVNSTKGVIEGEYIKFYQWDYVIKEYLLGRISFDNLKVDNKTIVIKKSVTYEEFLKNIKLQNVTVKIFKDNLEITSGNISDGTELRIYRENKLLDTYYITDNYIDLSNQKIRNGKYIITNVSLVSEFKKTIDTSGIVSIYDKDGKLLKDNDTIKTKSKINIKLSNANHEYTIVVLGDITGSGDIFIGDISKLYQYYNNVTDMDECYIFAGDINGDSKITEEDIDKLYQYYMGIINSL